MVIQGHENGITNHRGQQNVGGGIAFSRKAAYTGKELGRQPSLILSIDGEDNERTRETRVYGFGFAALCYLWKLGQ